MTINEDSRASGMKIIKGSASGLLAFGAVVGLVTLPAAYVGLVLAIIAGFLIGSVFAYNLLSVDSWLLVPASWGAAISAVVYASYVERTNGSFTGGWVIATGVGIIAVGLVAANRAGYDFRGRRAS